MENKVTMSYRIPGYPREAYTLTHVEMEINSTIAISDGNVSRTTISSCTGGWIRVNTGTSIEIKSLTPGLDGCRSIKSEVDYAGIEDFYSDSFISMYYFEELRRIIISRFGENISFKVRIIYEGTKYYKNLPVNVFSIVGNISGWNKEYGYINGFLKGYMYNHLGLVIPVKGCLLYTSPSPRDQA